MGLLTAPRSTSPAASASSFEAPRQALHALSISLARHPEVVEFARALVLGAQARDRMARVAVAFSFVNHLVTVPPPPAPEECRDGVDVLVALAGEQEGPAVILAALLQALGERACVDYAPGMAYVRVEIRSEDLSRLPPWSNLMLTRGRYYIPLDARRPRGPIGHLPRVVREAMLTLGLAARF